MRRPRKGYVFRWEVHCRYPGRAGLVGTELTEIDADAAVARIVKERGEGAAWKVGPFEIRMPER